MFAVIYHMWQYSMVQDFLWQDGCDNCDHSWCFSCVYSRIAELTFGLLVVKTVLCRFILSLLLLEKLKPGLMVKEMQSSHFTWWWTTAVCLLLHLLKNIWWN